MKQLFDTVRAIKGAPLTQTEVDAINLALAGDMQRHVSDGLIAALKGFEGVRLAAYPDPATGGDPWTIGVGHTGPDVRQGMTITSDEADRLLRADLAKFENGVANLAPVTSQGQFDALVSFAFNVGLGNLKTSTLLKKHNVGDYDGAAAQFGAWVNAAGKKMPGLVTRRAAEARIYRGLPA